MNPNDPAVPQQQPQPSDQPSVQPPQTGAFPPQAQPPYSPPQQPYYSPSPSQQQYMQQPASQQYMQQPPSQQYPMQPYTGQPPSLFFTPPPPNRNNGLIITLSIIGGVVILTLLTVLIFYHPKPSPTPIVVTPIATQVPTATPIPCLSQGDKAPVDFWSVSYLGADTQQAGTILITHATLENDGANQAIVSTAQFYLTDPTGKQVPNAHPPQNITANPGDRITADLSWNVPSGVHQFFFSFAPDSSHGATWCVNA